MTDCLHSGVYEFPYLAVPLGIINEIEIIMVLVLFKSENSARGVEDRKPKGMIRSENKRSIK